MIFVYEHSRRFVLAHAIISSLTLGFIFGWWGLAIFVWMTIGMLLAWFEGMHEVEDFMVGSMF